MVAACKFYFMISITIGSVLCYEELWSTMSWNYEEFPFLNFFITINVTCYMSGQLSLRIFKWYNSDY